MSIGLKRKIAKTVLSLLAFSLCAFPSGEMAMHAWGEDVNPTRSPEAPQRIVVLPLFAEEMLLEMIGPDRIVGVGHAYHENAEAYTPTMALTKDMQHDLDIYYAEGILAVNPDLVLLYEGNLYGYETLLPALEQAGVPFLFMEGPENFGDVVNSLTVLGDIVGAPEKAAQMVQVVEDGLKELKQLVASIPEDERIRATYYCDYSPSSIFDVIADAANVISDQGIVFVSRHYDYKEISASLLAEWNPNLIVVDPVSMDTDGTILDISKDYFDWYTASFYANPVFSPITAIQNHNVHPLNIYNSQYMLQSAMVLARLAYPDLFAEQGKAIKGTLVTTPSHYCSVQ